MLRFRMVTPDQIADALREEVETGKELVAIVLERGWVRQQDLESLQEYLQGAPSAPEPERPMETPAQGPERPAEVPAPAATTQIRLLLRLGNGDRVEAARFADLDSAKARAQQLAQELRAPERWPFLAGRYIRPAAVVSIDLELTPA